MQAVLSKQDPWYSGIMKFLQNALMVIVIVVFAFLLTSSFIIRDIICFFHPGYCDDDPKHIAQIFFILTLVVFVAVVYMVIRFIIYVVKRKSYEPIEEKRELKVLTLKSIDIEKQ